MKYIFLIYCIILINLSTACNKTSHIEKEPNDLLNNANYIQLNQSIEGNFQNIKDKDTFILDLRKLKKDTINIQINLSRIKGYDLGFDIYEENRLIKTVDDYRKSQNEIIYSIILTNKIYYIAVKISPLNDLFHKRGLNNIKHSEYPSENYSLSVKEQTIKPFYEWENNDTIDKANPLKINTFVEGTFDPFYKINTIDNDIQFDNKQLNGTIQKLEHDWYYVDLDAEGQYNMSIILEGVSDIDAILGVYHNKFNTLVNNKNNGEGESIINLSVEGLQRYYILVSGIPHGYKTNNKIEHSYRLSVNINSKDKPTEAEPNNNIKKANIINDNLIYGILSPQDDEDFYILEVTKETEPNIQDLEEEQKIDSNNKQKIINDNDLLNNKPSTDEQNIKEQNTKSLFASLSPVENIDLALYLYDEGGKVIRIYDTGGINEGENIQSFNVEHFKQIILSVKGSYQNKNDNYKESYKLETEIKEHNKDNYELEANDNIRNIQNAEQSYYRINKINPGTIIYGYINPGGKNPYQQSDIDNFEVKLKNNTNYEVSFKGIEGISIKLSIHYRDKSPVHNFDIIKSIDENIKTSTLKVPYDPFDPDSNIYNIKVETEFSKIGNSSKTYSFILQELPN